MDLLRFGGQGFGLRIHCRMEIGQALPHLKMDVLHVEQEPISVDVLPVYALTTVLPV